MVDYVDIFSNDGIIKIKSKFKIRIGMINYIEGDLFQHITHNDCVIHIVNNSNIIGGGFTKPLIVWFPGVKDCYHRWFDPNHQIPHPHIVTGPAKLGEIQMIFFDRDNKPTNSFNKDRCVVNMVAQEGVISSSNPHPLKYDALEQCLRKVAAAYEFKNMRIIAPKFGAGLAGGDWDEIEPLVNSIFQDREITIFEF